ncbi:MAG: hypothetical protein QOJ99_4973 [Bryobacterales bacterium]|nr:hypothetical protein [Bryobacterales bacterium]
MPCERRRGQFLFWGAIKYLKRLLGIVEKGGSVLLCDEFGREITAVPQRYPEDLFAQLDHDWRDFARQLDQDGLNLAKAAAAGLGLSEYLRKAALDIGLTHKYDQAAVHQLRKIGVNLNQIAHHLNAGNDLRGDVLLSLSRCLVKLEEEIDSRQGSTAGSDSGPAPP